jgi:hypothetical protein
MQLVVQRRILAEPKVNIILGVVKRYGGSKALHDENFINFFFKIIGVTTPGLIQSLISTLTSPYAQPPVLPNQNERRILQLQ